MACGYATSLRIGLCSLLILASAAASTLAADPTTTETIVMIRHGEKPEAGLGQLNCQGLNRALALPAVLASRFGRPAAIFAPNPSVAKDDVGKSYDYIRPLATIEPTAIALGLPVDASIGFADIQALQQKLAGPDLRDAVVLVAWEHAQLVELARALLASAGGRAKDVPAWRGSDFDGIYVIRIMRAGAQTTAAFEHGQQGLDNQPTTCPGQGVVR